MRRSDEMPLDPEILAELEVLDLTLAGEPVDPEYAELAELAVLIASERGTPSSEFTGSLDLQVERRFAPAPARWPAPSAGHGPSAGQELNPRHSRVPAHRSRLRGLLVNPGFAAGLVAVAVVAVVVVAVSTSHPGSSSSSNSLASNGSSATTASGTGTSGALHGTSPSSARSSAAANTTAAGAGVAEKSTGALQHRSSPSTYSTVGGTATTRALEGSAQGALSASAPAAVPAPNASGRKVVQSAQITLSTSGARIDTVSQEVFDVVSQEHGIVERSRVTSAGGKGNGGTAYFNLSIPTSNLESALGSLSALHYAHVLSRTDSTQDVTRTYRTDSQRLQDAQALRTSLLKQLAAATTQIQIDSLKAQLDDTERQINADQRTLSRLQHRISYSSLNVQLFTGTLPVTRSHRSSGLTIGRAAHDAGRVLVVAAGVILIVLAAMVPIGLVLALLAWIGFWVRQRRREQALDQT